MYCSLQSDRGFAIVESMIPRLNQLVSAAAALDGVENNYLRDEEWNMTGEGELGRLLTALAQNAGLFGKIDFDRSVNLAQQMERPELRLMAELKNSAGGVVGPAESDDDASTKTYELPYDLLSIAAGSQLIKSLWPTQHAPSTPCFSIGMELWLIPRNWV